MGPISSIIQRQNIALIFMGIAFSSLGYYLLLRSHFVDTQPRTASPSSGFTYPITSRGSSVFLSAEQATELGVLKYAFGVSFLLGVVLTRQATQTVRLVIAAFFFTTEGVSPYRSETLKRSSGKDGTFNGSPSLFFCSAALSFVIFWLSIPRVAAVLVLWGVILKP